MAKHNDLVVGLDIGTTKICCIVGEVQHDGLVDVVGIGMHPSTGLRKGVVVNIESTVASIKKAVEEAELMAGCEIHTVFAGIAGGHIKGFNSHGLCAVKSKEVTEGDIRRVIDAARAVAIPMDREVIHILPQDFIIDGQDGIKEPLGMSGVRLESRVHIVTGAVTSAHNIIKCCNRTGLNVADIVLEQLASSEAVLTPDEKELGVALIDIGGGTTDIAVFHEGAIKHTSVLALGGDHITSDIAIGLRTPTQEAEKIKRNFGSAVPALVQEDETIEVPSVGGRGPRRLSRKVLSEVIEPRVEEMFTLAGREIERSGYHHLLASGVVITGGTALLHGMPELGERIFEAPVRRGTPSNIGGLTDVVMSPMYATAVGLVQYGVRNMAGTKFRIREQTHFHAVMDRMKEWFTEFF